MNVQRIESGTPEGEALGFVESLYSGWLELRENHRLYLHFIISRNKNGGNTQALIRQWLVQGYDVRVVMPRPIMQHILDKLHFVPAVESLPEWYDEIVECWRRPKAWLLPALPDEEAGAGNRIKAPGNADGRRG
ncbi:MAG: hypothetical protein WAU66_05410 [Methanoregula sp.]|uniref:hypothetical protein n=1 Tax=Methanoregula sp. TaxID=2052170 RepID=UPI003BAFCB19